MSAWGVIEEAYEKGRVSGNELKKEVAADAQSAANKLQDATNEAALWAVAPYSNPEMKAYGNPGEKAVELTQNLLNERRIAAHRDLASKMTIKEIADAGYYDRPSTPEALMIGAGETFTNLGRGTQEIALDYNPFMSPESKIGKLNSLYERQNNDQEVMEKYLHSDQPISSFIGNQLPYVLPELGLAAARAGAIGYSKLATTVDDVAGAGLKYPWATNPFHSISGNPYAPMPAVNPLGATVKAFPTTFANYTNIEQYAPAALPVLDKLTPTINKTVDAVKNFPIVKIPRDIFNTGKVASDLEKVTRPIRPGSNVISRFADDVIRDIGGQTSVLGSTARGAAEGAFYGGLDINQTAGEGAALNAGANMLFKLGAGRISKPPASKNPVHQKLQADADALGLNTTTGIYTQDVPTQQYESAMAANSSISDVIKRKNLANDAKATLAITREINPLNPVDNIDSKWIDDAYESARMDKQNFVNDIGDSEFHEGLSNGYFVNRDDILGRVGGKEFEPMTGRVLQHDIVDGERVDFLSDDVYQISKGSNIYDDANISASTKKYVKHFDDIVSSGKMSGDQYRTIDHQLAMRLKRKDLPDIERELLYNVKQLVDEQAELALGPDAAKGFAQSKAREAAAIKLYEPKYVKDGLVTPGAFSTKGYYKNNWSRTLPKLTEISDAHDYVSTRVSSNLSSNDLVGKTFGRNPMGNSPFALLASRAMNGIHQNPVGDAIASGYYGKPIGVPEYLLNPAVASGGRQVAAAGGDPDFSDRVSAFAEKHGVALDKDGNVISQPSLLQRGIDEAKYQGQDLGLLDKDLPYVKEKTSRTFDKYYRRLKGDKDAE